MILTKMCDVRITELCPKQSVTVWLGENSHVFTATYTGALKSIISLVRTPEGDMVCIMPDILLSLVPGHRYPFLQHLQLWVKYQSLSCQTNVLSTYLLGCQNYYSVHSSSSTLWSNSRVPKLFQVAGPNPPPEKKMHTCARTLHHQLVLNLKCSHTANIPHNLELLCGPPHGSPILKLMVKLQQGILVGCQH